jgi:hypothetical protein
MTRREGSSERSCRASAASTKAIGKNCSPTPKSSYATKPREKTVLRRTYTLIKTRYDGHEEVAARTLAAGRAIEFAIENSGEWRATIMRTDTAYIPVDDIEKDDLVIARHLSATEAMKIAFGYEDGWRQACRDRHAEGMAENYAPARTSRPSFGRTEYFFHGAFLLFCVVRCSAWCSPLFPRMRSSANYYKEQRI